ncbi:DNA polymerase, partial [Escherichia coli]
GAFIINWLERNGFKWSADGLPNTYNTIISRTGQWYMIDICLGYKGKRKIHTVIYDSSKKLPFPVKKIAKDFKLTVLKGDIDYHKERPVGYKITPEEYAYIKNDIQIIAEALLIQFK